MKNSDTYARDGQFSVVKAVKSIRGRLRKLRCLVFTTRDGFTGESRRFDHREAYEAAIACKVKARYESAAACPKAPAPAALLQHIDESTLFHEVERRGYEVVVPEVAAVAPFDQDRWARDLLAEVKAS